jgi:phage gp46-like protein
MQADLALRYDPARGRGDFVFTGTGLRLDLTAATALIVSIGADRRARPDDALPGDLPSDPTAPDTLSARRGWVGDALNSRGERAGSRLWLAARAKMGGGTDPDRTRRLIEGWGLEAIAWLRRRGLAVQSVAERVATGRIRLTVFAGSQRLVTERAVAR